MKTEGEKHKIGTHAFSLIKKVESQSKRLIKHGDFQLAKELIENTLTKHDFKEPALFYLCGEANLALGYLIIAEQMFSKCISFLGYEAKSLNQIAAIAEVQGDTEKAVKLYIESLEHQNDWKVAYQVGLLLFSVYEQP